MKIESLHNLAYARFLAKMMPNGSPARRLASEAGRANRNASEDQSEGLSYDDGASMGASRGIVAGIAKRIDLSLTVTKKIANGANYGTHQLLRQRFDDIIASMPDTFTIGELLEKL